MTGVRCPVCLGYRRVRRDGHFARHTRGEVGAYCPGSGRDASAALAIDALGAEMQRREVLALHRDHPALVDVVDVALDVDAERRGLRG